MILNGYVFYLSPGIRHIIISLESCLSDHIIDFVLPKTSCNCKGGGGAKLSIFLFIFDNSREKDIVTNQNLVSENPRFS